MLVFLIQGTHNSYGKQLTQLHESVSVPLFADAEAEYKRAIQNIKREISLLSLDIEERGFFSSPIRETIFKTMDLRLIEKILV